MRFEVKSQKSQVKRNSVIELFENINYNSAVLKGNNLQIDFLLLTSDL